MDLAYLATQYGDTEKLRTRIEAHARYSEQTQDFHAWLLPHLDAAPGMTVLDAGCGSGAYHPHIAALGVRIVAADMSPGMVREARAQAIEQRLHVDALAADAQLLPFRGSSFDRVMANHMLYHVPDQPLALREMRRVLRPGGRAVFSTNAADNGRRIDEMHEAATRAAGLTTRPRDPLRFSLDDIDLVRAVFPAAEVFGRKDAFVFPDAAAALRYYATFGPDAIVDPPADRGHAAVLLESVACKIEEVIEREGVFRVPKNAGCFVATV